MPIIFGFLCQRARELEELGKKAHLAQLECDFELPREVILARFRGRKRSLNAHGVAISLLNTLVNDPRRAPPLHIL